MISRMSNCSIFFLLLGFMSSGLDDSCKAWFRDSKIASGKNCELQCSSLFTDMNTFQCPNQCDQLCKLCPQKDYSGLFKTEMVFEKDQKNISTLPFSNKQREQLSSILSRMPDNLLHKNLKGIVKMQKPIDPTEPSSGMIYMEGYILVYEATFDTPELLERKLVHELIHHLHENHGAQLFKKYKEYTHWNSSGQSRPGPFLSEDSKASAEEDFATNFEYYLIEPDKLKEKASKVHGWFKNNINNTYKLKGCNP